MLSGRTVAVGPALAIVVVALAVAGAAVFWLGGLGSGRPVLSATARAAAQLAVVSLLLAVVLRSAGLTVAFLVLMLGVAAATSAGRIGNRWRAPVVALPVAAGTVPVLAALLGCGLLPWQPIAVVPIAGILIGGAMTATSLAGRRCMDELRTRRGEYEAARALCLTRRDSVLLLCRPVAGSALVPALDQTRTVGLVTLPGTFVGVLLGGASPVQAGATQLVVLVGLLAAQAVAVLLTVELIAAGAITPGDGPLRP